MRKNKYQGYRAIDFLKDEDFLRWNFFKEENDNTYWKNVMEMSPELTPSIEKAILLYNTQVRLNDYSLAPEVIESHYTIFYQHVQQHRKRRSLYIWFSAVASLLLLFAITLIYQHSKEQPSELLEFVKATSFSKDTISKDIQLLVSSEEIIRIEEKEPTISYHSDSIRVTGKSVADLNASGYSRLIIPKGKRTRLTLSDGSTLHVNSGTEVIYPNRFTGNRREIYVNGEAFLEVTPDADQPFMVKTRDIEIRVLGTKFNVQAYEEDHDIQVVLVSGAVQVITDKDTPKTKLIPSQMYHYKEGQASVTTVDIEKHISWIHGILYAEDERLDVLMTKLSRYYGEEIMYDENVVNQRCSGKIDLKNDLREVLNGLTFSFPIETEYENGIFKVRTK
ncbi:FecR domain-containing protein [uncultured Proteiniphilum sp.]|uniref:FecR family protein n=1 Tax=uncultured Proteiniphilum sp. TaxID=497637 RepID=UPI00262128D4|nr:FecR domain-containing protein [uncultured Proteiniphilum sp.]